MPPGPIPNAATAPTNTGVNWGQVAQYGIPAVVGGLNYLGGREANATNARLAREQMAFQERMSNTSWQRAIADMKAAGINPALAYSQGGAGTPGGATATMQNVAAGGTNSAAAAAQTLAGLRATAAQIQNTSADTIKKGEEAKLAGAQVEAATISNNINNAIWEYEWRRGQKDKDNEGQITPFKIWMDRQEQRERINNISSSAASAAAQTELTRLDKPRMEAEANMYKTAFGRALPYATGAGQAIGMVRDITSMFRPNLRYRR